MQIVLSAITKKMRRLNWVIGATTCMYIHVLRQICAVKLVEALQYFLLLIVPRRCFFCEVFVCLPLPSVMSVYCSGYLLGKG